MATYKYMSESEVMGQAHKRAVETGTEQVVWRSGLAYHVLPLGEPPLDDNDERIAEIAA